MRSFSPTIIPIIRSEFRISGSPGGCNRISAREPRRYASSGRGREDPHGHLQRAYALDVSIRIEDEKDPPQGAAIEVEEFNTDGVVYEKNGVRVIAFEVDHGEAIKPAYGYRIEYDGRAVVLSGDTRFNQNVIKYGAGADLLVHEVAIAPPALLAEPFIQRIMAHHTTATRGREGVCPNQAEARRVYAPGVSSERRGPAGDDRRAHRRNQPDL